MHTSTHSTHKHTHRKHTQYSSTTQSTPNAHACLNTHTYTYLSVARAFKVKYHQKKKYFHMALCLLFAQPRANFVVCVYVWRLVRKPFISRCNAYAPVYMAHRRLRFVVDLPHVPNHLRIYYIRSKSVSVIVESF